MQITRDSFDIRRFMDLSHQQILHLGHGRKQELDDGVAAFLPLADPSDHTSPGVHPPPSSPIEPRQGDLLGG
jgi:hypothetical protein